MKFLCAVIAFVCLVAPIFGKPVEGEENLIIRSESENNGDGTYRYLWETSDGTHVEESGYLKPNGNANPIQVAEGSYQYLSPEEKLIRVTYIADENGFQPKGDHLPTPPPTEGSSSLDQDEEEAPKAPGSQRNNVKNG
ncbi:unnamed protein product [Orchesella dallaii]|uniref:Uncharacterized protein n=1 Tax=Orchesella dallaii TaxID=48710 RepID=A0ABP1PNU9_9HEXA